MEGAKANGRKGKEGLAAGILRRVERRGAEASGGSRIKEIAGETGLCWGEVFCMGWGMGRRGSHTRTGGIGVEAC